MAGKNAFDTLLESLAEEERKVVEEVGQKVPKLRDAVLAQADYSRKMDEMRSKVTLADEWNKWRGDNWVDIPDHPKGGMTKAEMQRQQQLEEMQRELEQARQAALATGEEMTFEQLNERLKSYTKESGLMSKTDVDGIVKAKETELQNFVKGNVGTTFTAAMVASELNLKHYKEFGEPFNAEEFLKSAVDKGRLDLRDYYEKDFVLDRRQKRQDELHKAELEKVQKERDEAVKAAQEAKDKVTAATMGTGVVDGGGPELGPLQRQMMGQPVSGDDLNKPPEAPLGTSSLAQWAARRDEAKAAGARQA